MKSYITSILKGNMTITHRNWNDMTIEGILYNDSNTFSVQFHPEAAPGPEDTAYLFDEFIKRMEKQTK